jgi:hypothetical protein
LLCVQECGLFFWGAGMVDQNLQVIDKRNQASSDASQELD